MILNNKKHKTSNNSGATDKTGKEGKATEGKQTDLQFTVKMFLVWE